MKSFFNNIIKRYREIENKEYKFIPDKDYQEQRFSEFLEKIVKLDKKHTKEENVTEKETKQSSPTSELIVAPLLEITKKRKKKEPPPRRPPSTRTKKPTDFYKLPH